VSFTALAAVIDNANQERLRGAKVSERCILMLLAYRHNHETGKCCPHIKTISKETGLSPRAVRANLTLLEQRGVLTRRPILRGQKMIGQQYDLNVDPPENKPKRGAESARVGRQNPPNRGAESAKTGGPNLPPEQKEEERKKRNSGEREAAIQEFESQFWPAWPKKAARKDAAKAYVTGRLNGMPAIEELLASIKKHSGGKQWLDGFIPHAATWIRGERWGDEVDTPRPTGRHAAPAWVDPAKRKIKTRRTS